MVSRRGAVVEISGYEEGFMGSYYTATVLSPLKENHYLVEYRTLVNDDQTKLLRDIVGANLLRPCPPEIPVSGFSIRDVVDVYANDGWWVGEVKKKTGLMYSVYFESSDEEIEYPVYRLRVHQDWVGGKWVAAKKRV